jgi:non-heme chloroperoxidase
MRSTLAHSLTASALLSFTLLAGCTYDDAQDPPVSSQEPLFETTSGSSSFSKKSISLSTGITMKYVEVGPWWGEPVILLHGLTDTSRSFFPTLQALLAANTHLHVFALDQRGHGATSMPSTTSCRNAPESCFEMSDLAADVISFMNKKGLTRAHIVGHSMGSFVAQELALTSPSRVESLMLIGSLVKATDHPAVHFFLTPVIEEMWRGMLEAQNAAFVWPRDAYLLTPRNADPDADTWMAQNWVIDPTADPAFINSIIPETSTTKLGTWIGVVRNFANSFDTSVRLRQLTRPTLVLWATQDNFMVEDPDQVRLRASLDAAVNACRTSYYYKFYGMQPLPPSGFQESDLGHNTPWGAGEAVAADITAWIEDGEPTNDLPYADPNNVQNLLIAPGAAQIIERHPPSSCN